MRKDIVIIGTIVALAGISLLLSSFAPMTVFHDDLVSEVENQWSISGYYPAGVNLTLIFNPNHDWSLPYYPDLGEPSYQKHFMASITNEATGNYTTFKVVLLVPRGQIPPQPPYNFLLTVYEIEVTHHGGLIADDKPSHGIEGITENEGEYSVECELIPPIVEDRHLENGTLWIHDASPPQQLMLRIVGSSITHPYSYLLPVGLTGVAAGLMASVLGFRQPAKTKRYTRTRSSATRLKLYLDAG